MTILVVEDDYTNQRYLEILLEKYDKVVFAKDGQQGLDAFHAAHQVNQPYSVLFIDVVIPKIDGNELTITIRKWEKEHPEAKKSIIIIETARVLGNEISESLATGCDLFLTKPFLIEHLDGFMKECGFTKHTP